MKLKNSSMVTKIQGQFKFPNQSSLYMENNKKNNKEIKLTSLGAAQTVTGSKHLLEWDRHHFLIDCGLYQGQETKGWPEWDYQQFNQEYIRKIHAVFLTHAHLDHCGYLPKLIRDGFNGPIYATQATYELAEIIMRDAAKIAQNEARTKNKKINKESQKITPLYQTIHVEQTLKHFKIVNFNKPFNLGPFQITYHYAGHIPGASSVSLTHALQKKTILFSGDLGRHDDPLLRPPTPAPNADVVVVESTYGDRLHKRPENGHQGDHKENHE
jgi:metallo-beta-lactamase family protein